MKQEMEVIVEGWLPIYNTSLMSYFIYVMGLLTRLLVLLSRSITRGSRPYGIDLPRTTPQTVNLSPRTVRESTRQERPQS